MAFIATRVGRIKPSPSSMAGQRARELRATGRDILSLTAGEPDFNTPDNIIQAALRAMQQSKTKYTDVSGVPELREAIAQKFKRENEIDYKPAEIMVGTGAKQIIFNALMCTVDKGDEVIVPAPYWVSYPDIVLLADGKPVFAQCPAERGFKLQPDDLERLITPHTKWLILNAPNNPSGAIYSREELKAIGEVLLRHPHVWLMTDDIYEHLIYDGKPFFTMAQVVPELKGRTLTVNGVSKAYAMTGWRIGYGAAPADMIKSMVKLQSQSTSNPSSVSQAGALEALTGPQDFLAPRRESFQSRRDYLVQGLNAIPDIRCHSPEGAFYAYPSCAQFLGMKTKAGKTIKSDSDFILHLLDSENLAVLQGAAYGTSPYFRMSFATSTEQLEIGLTRLRKACAALERA